MAKRAPEPFPAMLARELARARMINAAPDMLAALKAVDQWARDLEPFADAGTQPVTVFQQVRAAIAKAEGQS